MTTESILQVDSVNSAPEIKLNDDSHNTRYTREEFDRQLEKAQNEEISIGRQDPRYIAPEPTDINAHTENPVPVQDNPLSEEPNAVQEEERSPWEDDEDLGHGPIPKKRFNKEIEKRKLLEEQLNKEREERIKAQATIDMYNKALEEASKPRHEERDHAIDPIDPESHNHLTREINELKQQLKQQNENLSHSQQQQTINQALLQQRAEFMQRQPDFQNAYEHLMAIETRRNELIGHPKAEAARLADQALMAQAVEGLRSGKDVPSMLYDTAKVFGYTPKQAAAQRPTGPNLKNIERNIPKSDSILNDIPEVSARPAPEAAAFVSNDGFARHLMNKDGRGVDVDAFKKAIEKLRNGM